jgi:hypothetical protein
VGLVLTAVLKPVRGRAASVPGLQRRALAPALVRGIAGGLPLSARALGAPVSDDQAERPSGLTSPTSHDTLREAHHDPYVYADSAASDVLYREALASVGGPMSRLDAARLPMPSGDVGHARLEFPTAGYVPYVTGGGRPPSSDVRVGGDRADL